MCVFVCLVQSIHTLVHMNVLTDSYIDWLIDMNRLIDRYRHIDIDREREREKDVCVSECVSVYS